MAQSARDALARNRREAIDISQRVGARRLREHMLLAEKDLVERLARVAPTMQGTFTEQQMRATLAQIRQILRTIVQPGLRGVVLDTGLTAADAASGGTLEYLNAIERSFRGVGAQPLALNEASMIDAARYGARASILQRIATSGEDVPGAEKAPHLAKLGVLDRYGVNVIGAFEKQLRTGLLARKPWEEVKAALTEESPFLQGAPSYWAERIVRTESMNAYSRAAWEATREADEQLGDMVKILTATFDDRTAADSYAVHGQIRRPEEPFETWYGPMMHPPARPNDREIVVPHRVSWPIPAYLKPKTRGEVVERWRREKRKGVPPATPPDTTVPRRLFGRQEPPKLESA